MNHVADNWYFGWGWMLWLFFVFLMFSSIGNWGYTYRVHRKYGGQSGSNTIDIVNERYARGDVTREQFLLLKADISKALA